MTENKDMLIDLARKNLRELLAGEIHPAPCACPSCLFFEYRKLKKGPGKPIGKYLFFLDWLIWRIKMEAIESKCNTFPVKIYFNQELADQIPGSLTWSVFEEKYKKAPYMKRALMIIDSLYAEFEELEFLSYEVLRVYKVRFDNDRFIKLIESLQQKRGEAFYNEPEKKKEVKATWERLRLAQRVADYVISRPGKKAYYREILRHFSNKRKADIENIRWLLCGNYQIRTLKSGSSLIFTYSPPTVEQVRAATEMSIQKMIEKEKSDFQKKRILD